MPTLYISTNNYRSTIKALKEARFLSESINEKSLFTKIDAFEKSLLERGFNTKDYVSEMGLDMP